MTAPLEPKIPIAARSIAVLRNQVGPVVPLPGLRDNNVLVVDPGDQRRQLWVRPKYSDYRKAWLRVFIHIPDPQLEVDHLLNRARAVLRGFDYEYVRLFLCPKNANQRHGAFLEKRLTRVGLPPGALSSLPDLLYANNWIIAKMAGIAIDRSNPTYDQASALEWLVDKNFM